MENKEYLIKKLKLTDAIVKNDENAVEIAKTITKLTEEQERGIFNLLDQFIDNDNNSNIVKNVIKEIEFKDKEYLLDIIDLKQLNYFRDSENFEKTIREKLESNKDFKDEMKNYIYYSLIVNLVISSKDSELIELAINKLQSI